MYKKCFYNLLVARPARYRNVIRLEAKMAPCQWQLT